jgi:hypothetical protein
MFRLDQRAILKRCSRYPEEGASEVCRPERTTLLMTGTPAKESNGSRQGQIVFFPAHKSFNAGILLGLLYDFADIYI